MTHNDLTQTSNIKPISVREMLTLPQMPSLELMAGSKGLDRIIENVSVYEVVDAYKWLKPNQLILSTFLAVPPSRYEEVFKELSRGKVSCIVLCYTEIYYGGFPESIIELSDRYEIPLFSANKEIAYVDIMMPVMQSIIDSESGQLHLRIEVMNEINKLLLQGATFSSFLSLIHKFISKPLLLIDREYEVLALNASKEEDRECIMGFINNSLSDYIKALERNPAPESRMEYKRNKVHLLSFPVVSNKWIYGQLIVFDEFENLSEESQIIIEQCSEGLSVLFMNYYSELIHQQNAKIELLNIISKQKIDSDDQKTLENGLAALGVNFTHELRLVFLKFNDKALESQDKYFFKRRFNRISELIKMFFNHGLCFEKEGSYILLLPYIRKVSFLRNLDSLIEQLNRSYHEFGTIISPRIKTIEDFNQSYEITRRMQELKQKIPHSDQVVLWSDDYKIFVYLHKVISAGEQPLVSWANELLSPLLMHEKEKNRELYENLKLLLIEDVDVKKVAPQLHIHKNTLQYRMNKIREILGEDPFHEKRFDYTLAVYILMLLETDV